ncbi:MAG: hypothetical protein ACR2PX_24820 [Endozoicomonas sp.]|uniref:YVTN family beta-propeller repeat protein n=1 Tax=Endozoicomonas sp. TaxID=1892382 RepID=UPI003D9B31ED
MKKFGLPVIAALAMSANLSFATDLVYTANQNDNTVSIINADDMTKVGDLKLGLPAGEAKIFSPLYNGQINVHGLSYSPERHELAVVSTVTNSVVFVDTNTGNVKRTVYVGRNPHEPRYNNGEVWVTVRGENHVAVVNPDSGEIAKKIELSSGPGMVTFGNDGHYAYVSSSFNDDFWIVDTTSKDIIKTLKMPSNFSPFLNTSPDGKEVWVGHKDNGHVTRIDTKTMDIIETFETGKVSNHLTFANNKVYVTVGGENKINVYTYGTEKAGLVKTIKTETLPHGIWGSDDGKYVYYVNELSATAQVIDTATDKVIKKLEIGALPQALVFAKNATDNVAAVKENINKEVSFRGPRK